MPIDIEFSIWLASKTRWVHLAKVIAMKAVPRVGEFVKFKNPIDGETTPFRVTEIIYRESGPIEVWTELLENIDNRGYSFEEEVELDEYYASYVSEGWRSERGIGLNRRYQEPHNPTSPIQ